MLNRTDIINMALRRCGAAGVNLGFQHAPDSAIAMAAFKRCYAYVLTQYPWSFAQRYLLLAQDNTIPVMGYRSPSRVTARPSSTAIGMVSTGTELLMPNTPSEILKHDMK